MTHARRLAIVTTLALATAGAGAAPLGGVVRVAHHGPDAMPTRGPAAALVTIELFFVPGVHTRQPLYHALEQLAAAHPSRIRLIYRLVKANQINVADAALEALAQGKYPEMIAAIDASQVPLSREKLVELGRGLGLDGDQLEAAMVEGRYADVLAANDDRHTRLHGVMLPDVLFNGERIHHGSAPADLEAAYQDAYARAVELVDRGVDPRALPAWWDAAQLTTPTPPVVGHLTNDASPDQDFVLADPPLALAGLPSRGPAAAAVPVVVLCAPTDPRCYRQLEIAAKIQRLYPGDVRVVWSPWFAVAAADAATSSLLADAALCAEALGDGWDWLDQAGSELARHRTRGPDAGLAHTAASIDAIARTTQINRRALARCQAGHAGDALTRVTAATDAGVRTELAVIVGGRIYGAGVDQASLQQLVEAELAPGVLGELAPAPTVR